MHTRSSGTLVLTTYLLTHLLTYRFKVHDEIERLLVLVDELRDTAKQVRVRVRVRDTAKQVR